MAKMTRIRSKGNRRGPDHSLSKRQARKLESRLAELGYEPVYNATDPRGNRLRRRGFWAERRGKATVNGRKKAQKRGEFCGRKLERLVRCGAPLCEVNSLKAEIRDFLHKAALRG